MSFKKKSIFISGLALIAILGGVFISNKSTNTNMIEEQVQIKDINTYYTFTGNIQAVKSQVVSLTSESEIKDILVKESDNVKNGTSLLKTTSGAVLKSKIDGEVAEISVTEDVKYPSGTTVATIVNYDKLHVDIKVNEYEATSIKIGDTVDVYVDSLDKTVEGKIVNLSKNATVVNDIPYFRCIVEIEDTEDILVGMSAEVKASKDSVKEVKTISMNALEFDSDNQPYVYIKGANGSISEKSVSIGINDGVIVEIKSGLKANDTVLSSNNTLFDPFEMMQHGGN